MRALLSVLIMTSGLAFSASALSDTHSHHSDADKRQSYGKLHKNFEFSKRKDCSEFISIWRPQHPRACDPVITWSEISEGLSLGVSSQAFDRNKRVMYSDITVQNNTGDVIPAGSKLIISDANAKLKNATGVSDLAETYIATEVDIANGDSLVMRAEFRPRLVPLTFATDFEILEISDGVVTLTSDANYLLAQIPRTLIADVSDPDGISTEITYQWLADGELIEGATDSSYKLTVNEQGKSISVQASYIDDGAFAETILSAASSPVLARAENVAGEVRIDGERILGSTLHAATTDQNGITQTISYQWLANGVAIAGATDSYLVLDASLLGKNITAQASYTDFADYSETPSSTTSHIATTIVSGEAELVAAVAAAGEGDWIALASGDYASMAELELAGAVTLTAGEASDAVISGATCIVLSGNNSGLVGLTFDELAPFPGSACDSSNKQNNIWLSGNNIVVSENSFLGHVADLGSLSEYNWIYVRGNYNLIERNLFTGKNLDVKGAAISIYNKGDGSEGGHVVQYNLFKDMPGTSVQSSAYVVQVGRSTGTDSTGEGMHIVRYNLFDNVKADRRIIKVQASRSSVYSNTIINSTGGIALEDGYENTASNNVILSAGDNSDDSGITFSPFGHTITGNYIAGLKTTSSQRAALLLNTETFANSGNSTLEVSPVTIANNTVINSNQAIATYSSSKCVADVFVANFDSNLVANGVEGQGDNGSDDSALLNDCSINTAESTFNNEVYYAAGADLVDVTGGVGEASLVVSANGLLEEAGAVAGADADSLIVLTESDVGPGSTYVALPTPTSYNGSLALDFNNWYITFPNGESEYNPQWLLDGNTSDDEFFYAADGGAVFKTPNIGGTTSSNTKYSRTELREMLRGPDQDPQPADWPKTQGVNKNNWVFSNSYQRLQYEAGGVDGVLEATLKVDHVSTTYDDGYDYMLGRVIVGQIHASDDEPLRLYYRKLPGNDLGSVYFATEVPGIGDTQYYLIGDSDKDSANPVDGIALGEVWSYRVQAKGDDLTVTVMREGKPNVSRTVKTAPVYANDWMFFKAGVYNQNNGGSADDYAQATFYSIVTSHDEPPADPGNGEDEAGAGGTSDVVDGSSLQAAILAASYGDTIEISDGDYSNMGTVIVADGVTVTRAEGSTAVISGEFCLQVSGDDSRITGLQFADLVLPTDSTNYCRSNGDGNIVITGDNVTFDNNLLDGDAVNSILDASENTHNWLVVKGNNTLVERNTFQNKAGLIEASGAQVRGSFISVFVNGSVTGATIQYNLFKDMLLNSESTAAAVQVGRTTGSDSNKDGFHLVQYNRFENIDSKTRLIRVQGSNNVITHNTVVDSQGMISLEDGQQNEVSYNVILPSGSDSNDGGISAAPYGHTIIGNYIAGSKTTSSERGGIYLNSNANGSGNAALVASTVEVSGNTIINTKQPIHIGSKGCGNGPAFIADFSNNLVASGVDGVSEDYEGVTVTGKAAVRYSCELDATSTLSGEAYYTSIVYDTASAVTTALPFDASSVFGTDGAAELAAGTNGLIEAVGAISGKGADTSELLLINEADVGVGSTVSF